MVTGSRDQPGGSKDPTRKAGKQLEVQVEVSVPFLVDAIRLHLDWPILSGATDSKDARSRSESGEPENPELVAFSEPE